MGVVVAGGRGARLGGAKATVALAGRPLLTWALDALRPVASELAVVAKEGTPLPELPAGVALWHEPASGHHPRHGLVHALERAAGRSVVALAVDLPLVAPATLRRLVDAADARPAPVATAGGRPQPLCAVYAPAALGVLATAAAGERLTVTVDRLHPVLVEPADPVELANVNTPEDLARVAALVAEARADG